MMTTSVKESLAILAALQRIDTQRASIEKFLSGVSERVDSLGRQLVSFEAQVADGLRHLEDLRKQYRRDESELKTIESSVLKSEQKLHAVKTNKEYQSTLKEIDDLKHKASTVQDQMLTALEAIEAAEKQVAVLKADLVDMQKEIEENQASIRAEADSQRSVFDALDERRHAVWASLDAKMQKIYNRALQQGHGVAVAAVVDGVCQVCRMNLPPQAYIELMRMNSLEMCPVCQRLIYPAAMIDPTAIIEDD